MLVDFFKNILNNSSDWESETVALARGYLSFLSEFETKFLLNVLSKIYAYIDILYNILQTKHLDILYCVEKVNETKRIVLHERYRFDALWSDVCNEVECEEVPRKRKCLENDVIKYRRIFFEKIDNVTNHITDRFGNLPQLEFISLLDPNKFQSYKLNFPNSALDALNVKHSAVFDIVRLKNELTVLYSMEEFRGKYPHELVTHLKSKQLHTEFVELYKLTLLVLTIPSTSASAERSFSALKRIKSLQRSTQGQERLSSLALMSIEKKKLKEIRKSPTFHSDVIEEFSKKERRMEFTFK